jgi:cyclohexanecarboxyl-CoA dehydrogenase
MSAAAGTLDGLLTSEQHEAYRAEVRAFAERELAPHTKRWDREDRLPWDGIAKMAEAGLLGVISPKALGGQERDYVSLGITIEELARVDVSCAIICWLQATLGALIPGWGDDELRRVNRGEKLLALATSEEEAGSDVSAMQTDARLEGDQYVLNGTKIHVSLVPGAALFGVTAKTSGDGAKPGITMFLVPADLSGVSCSRMEQLGARAHQLGRVAFKDVRVPATAVLGAGGSGKKVMYARFNVSRCLSPLAAIGAALATLDMTVEFAKNKIVFGRPIGTNQAISFPLIEHYSRLEAARLMAYKALWMNDRALDAVREAAMAKWFGITSATQAISDCLAIHGANGYLTELPLEQKLRDVMALQFTGGTINVMKLLLVKDYLGKEFTGI